MIEKKVYTVNKESERLVGIESIPSEDKEKYSTVLLVHGFGVTKEEGGMFDELAAKLVKAGFLVYRFDFSGRGESEGDYSLTSISKLKSDLECILDFIRAQEKVDVLKIGIHAQSFGTPVTVAFQPDVAALILMGSISHPQVISGSEIKWEILDKKGISKKVKGSGEVIYIKSQFWEDMENYNLLDLIRGIRCPILFIHGELDEKVPLSDMESYFENANEPKEKLILKGADHSLEPCRDIMYKASVDFFKKCLG